MVNPHGSVCGIDPGAPPKTIFAHTATSEFGEVHPRERSGGWVITRKPPVSCFDIVAAEKPTGVIRANRTPASVVSPAGWGMAALFSCNVTADGVRLWVPMEAWKDKAYPNGARTKKSAFCGWLVADLQLTGLDPEADRDQDIIEAIGLSETLARFTRKELNNWRVKW